MGDLINARRPFIDGAWVAGQGPALQVDSPATEQAVASVETTTAAQVEAAILAARRAFDEGPWPRLTMEERLAILGRFADALDARRDLLVETVIAEAGCPRVMTELTQVDMGLASCRELLELYGRMPTWEHNELPLAYNVAGSSVRLSIRRYEAAGVVAAITPYNFPFITNVWKVVPALAAGCTVVLRPSPLTPLEALVLGEASEEAGLPPGVLNVVVEAGNDGGVLLSTHPAVDLVSFTGSTTVGRAIASQAAPTLKRVILELGGKSVQLHLPDVFADGMGGIVTGAMNVFAAHAGQGCALQTRMLVPHEHKAAVVDAVSAAAASLTLGDPSARETMVGPLISEAQRDRVASIVEAGVADGGRVTAGGGRPAHLDRGWFYEPTVVDVPDNSNTVAQR